MTTNERRPNYLLLRRAAKDARSLAQRLFNNDTTGPCTQRERCFEREEKRLKGYPTLPDNSTMRSYSYIDPHKLCDSCCAYWHAEMAAQRLEHMVVMEQHIAADEKRELPKAEEE
jgi:hypothetical protein